MVLVVFINAVDIVVFSIFLVVAFVVVLFFVLALKALAGALYTAQCVHWF